MANARPITFKVTETGCHECTSHARDHFGYPRIKRRKENVVMLHRWVYMQKHGPIPRGLVVRHKCDNPPCINVDHLELGTLADNVRDRDERGRTSRVSRTNGVVNGMSKLSASEIQEIRSLRGTLTQSKIAARFGISQTHVSGIQTGRYWKHTEVTHCG